MSGVTAAITTSLDGFVAAPGDVPGRGLGEGGERLHNWVFGGPWRYEDATRGEPRDEDARWLAQAGARTGAVICGRWTYEAARHWGGRNPAGKPFFVLTHRPAEQPEGGQFAFVSGLEAALERAGEAADGKDVHVMGGADTIRQALAAGAVDELTIVLAPLVLGAGKRLFEGFEGSLELEQLDARQSALATFLTYRVRR